MGHGTDNWNPNYRVADQSVEFTRPSDVSPYTAGDVVSNSTSATTLMDFSTLARFGGGSGYIVGAVLTTNKKSITPIIRVHLYDVTTITVAADNVAHKELYADVLDKIGSIDLPAMTTPTDTTNSDVSRTQDFTIRVPFKALVRDRSIFALLEAVDAFTPASAQKFSLALFADQG